jgi:hypothetical protein
VGTVPVVPVILTVAIAVSVMLVLGLDRPRMGLRTAAVLGGVVILAAGAVAAISSIVAKWVLVGTIRSGEHPLWSSFIWRNEVVDTFIEMVSAPWFARSAAELPPWCGGCEDSEPRSEAERGAKATGFPKPTS